YNKVKQAGSLYHTPLGKSRALFFLKIHAIIIIKKYGTRRNRGRLKAQSLFRSDETQKKWI
ncbi:MAG: hypothetical protein ACI85I_002214, partial [Arenicella sp.]